MGMSLKKKEMEFMNLKLNGYETLKQAIISEGDSLVESNECFLFDESVEGVIPKIAADVLGYVLKDGKEFVMVTKRFSSGWSNQIYVSFPLPTLMNDNLGVEIESGRVGRYIQTNPFDSIFHSLTDLFTEMNYRGFVSIKLTSDMELIDILFGAGLSLYNMLEGIKGKISDFLIHDEYIMESWSASLVVSRYPYPFQLEGERLFIKLNQSAMKHLWFYDLNVFKKTAYTDANKVCIVTAWATTLNEVARRIYRTCEGLVISANLCISLYSTEHLTSQL